MHEIRIAAATDADEVGRVLAAGFSDDPVLTWVFAEPDRSSKLSAFFAFLAAEALVPLGATYVTDDACASWTPPDTPPWPDERGPRFHAALAPVCGGDDFGRLMALGAAMDAHHPTEAHWYLGLLAAVPVARGRGLGSALLERSLAAVDDAGLPAYLESTNRRNVTIYERHGFEETGRIVVPDGPELTPMWRPARQRMPSPPITTRSS